MEIIIRRKSDKKENKKFMKLLERNPSLVLGICITIVSTLAFIVILFLIVSYKIK